MVRGERTFFSSRQWMISVFGRALDRSFLLMLGAGQKPRWGGPAGPAVTIFIQAASPWLMLKPHRFSVDDPSSVQLRTM